MTNEAMVAPELIAMCSSVHRSRFSVAVTHATSAAAVTTDSASGSLTRSDSPRRAAG